MRCQRCQAVVESSTAKKNDGLCARCYRSKMARPPRSFAIPARLAQRMAALGEDSDDYRLVAWREGPAFLDSYLSKLAQSRDLSNQWFPQLREFAAACRLSNPVPATESLPTRELAKLPIYDSLIRRAERLAGRSEHEVLICCLPVLAIPLAQGLWPGEVDRCVFLTPEELTQWHRIYHHPEDAFWWFIHYWWVVEDPPKPDSIWTRDGELTVPHGADPWLVVSGLRWGDMAGGENAGLWSWDGRQATLVGPIGHCSF